MRSKSPATDFAPAPLSAVPRLRTNCCRSATVMDRTPSLDFRQQVLEDWRQLLVERGELACLGGVGESGLVRNPALEQVDGLAPGVAAFDRQPLPQILLALAQLG